MDTYIIEKIKKMEGTLIGIGIENKKIKEEIQNNSNIKTCYLLEKFPSILSKKKFQIFNNKTVNIKKIKKVFKKKRIDNIICNYETVKPFLKTFVRDSVYINKNKLYIYGEKEDIEKIVERYKRYTDEIEIKKEQDSFLIIVDNKNTSNKKITDIKYWWIDTLNNIADILTAILVN